LILFVPEAGHLSSGVI